MRSISWTIALLTLCGGIGGGSALFAATPSAGRWTIRVAGRPMLLLDIRKEKSAAGGWTGALVAPRHFNLSANFTVFENVEGPAVTEPIVSATPHADALELTVRDSSDLTKLLWTPDDHGNGTLEFVDAGVSSLHLVPAHSDDRVSDSWDKSHAYSVIPDLPDNPEMTAMFNTDQSDRANMDKVDWNVIATHDHDHQVRTRALLDAGKLRSGTDFYNAAFVFQHGQEPGDYLLAHTLAVVAAARGRPDAAWIAAATLDRYLQSIGQKQIYGTQFLTPKGAPVTQGAYDRSFVSDALRKALGVPALADQEKERQDFQKQMDALDKSHPTAAKR
jgi:hypothetical protein